MAAPERPASSHRITSTRARVRAGYVAAAVATIGLGLLVHLGGSIPGSSARDVVGDALWGMMIAWWAGAFAPGATLPARSAAALALCAAVEASQLIHWSPLDSIRATRPGHLVLGSGFDPRDLLAYAIGVAGAAILESSVRQKRKVPP